MKLSSVNLPDKIFCPTSKSYAARALILAALKSDKVILEHMPSAQDTLDLINVLKQVGLIISEHKNQVIVENSYPACEKEKELITLDAGEGGTTIRFILPLLALGSRPYHIQFAGRMNDRPMEPIYQALRTLGVKVEKKFNGVLIQGPISNECEVSIDCSKSSQFASGFQHLTLLKQYNWTFLNLTHSLTYLEMSKTLVEHFKVQNTFSIPADFSSLGYLVAHAIFHGDLLIENVLVKDPLQADSKLFDVLDQIGVTYTFSDQGLFIKQCHEFNIGFEVDGSQCIDLVPTLMFIASYLPYTSLLKNIEKLQYKESDRLKECLNILKLFKVDHQYLSKEDKLSITGVAPKVDAFSYYSENDHRMVMLISLFMLKNDGGEIGPETAVNKSFPEFFQYFGKESLKNS